MTVIDSIKPDTTFEDWWDMDGATGMVPTSAIAETKENSRMYFDDAKIASLAESIRQYGVREDLIVTPRHLCADWLPTINEYGDGYFIAVSGNRRRRSAEIAGCESVPVKIRTYPNFASYMRDIVIHNKEREDLCALEEAHEIKDLREVNYKWEDVASIMGMSVQAVRVRLQITYLPESVQDRLHPRLPKDERLGIGIAEKLGGLSCTNIAMLEKWAKALVQPDFPFPDKDTPQQCTHALHEMALATIDERHLKDGAAKMLLDNAMRRVLEKENMKGGSVKRKPSKSRGVLNAYLDAILSSQVSLWSKSDIATAMDNASIGDIKGFLVQTEVAQAKLQVLWENLDRVRQNREYAEERAKTPLARKFTPDAGKSVLGDPEAMAAATKYLNK